MDHLQKGFQQVQLIFGPLQQTVYLHLLQFQVILLVWNINKVSYTYGTEIYGINSTLFLYMSQFMVVK